MENSWACTVVNDLALDPNKWLKHILKVLHLMKKTFNSNIEVLKSHYIGDATEFASMWMQQWTWLIAGFPQLLDFKKVLKTRRFRPGEEVSRRNKKQYEMRKPSGDMSMFSCKSFPVRHLVAVCWELSDLYLSRSKVPSTGRWRTPGFSQNSSPGLPPP